MRVTKRGGVTYLSLKDWPTRRERNVMRPVPIEEYLGMKFDQVNGQFVDVAKRLEALDARVQSLEGSRQALEGRLQALEGQPHAPAAQDADGHIVQPEPFISADEPVGGARVGSAPSASGATHLGGESGDEDTAPRSAGDASKSGAADAASSPTRPYTR